MDSCCYGELVATHGDGRPLQARSQCRAWEFSRVNASFRQHFLDKVVVLVVILTLDAFQVLDPLLGAASDFPGPVALGDALQATPWVALQESAPDLLWPE